MNPNAIKTEFFSSSKELDLGFCHWKKKSNYPGLFENFPQKFNYFAVKSTEFRKYVSPDFFLGKKRYNSYALQLVELKEEFSFIDELKLTNIEITDWDDIWQNKKGEIVDPKIRKLNLSHNLIKNISILDKREYLEEINFSFNEYITYVNVSNSSKLKEADLSYCPSLDYINFSNSPNLNKISIKNCNCSEICLESLLRNITPKLPGYLDLTGNSINWGNRNIASKIRLLLANDWKISWDSNPPDSIIPLGYWKRFDPLLLDRNFR